MSGVLAPKKAHAAAAFSLAVGALLVLLCLGGAFTGNLRTGLSDLDGRKSRIVALEERQQKSAGDMATYRQQMGVIAETQEASDALAAQELDKLQNIFDADGLVFSRNPPVDQSPFRQIEINAVGESRALLTALSSIEDLSLKISQLSLGPLDHEGVNTPFSLSLTLIYYSGGEDEGA